MINYEVLTLLTTTEAASVMDISPDALRQMVARKKLPFRKIGKSIYIDNDDVSNYYAKRQNLPVFEDLNGRLKLDTFFSLEQVQQMLGYTRPHLKSLIKRKKLEAFCAVNGTIMIPQSSINNFMGVDPNEPEESEADEL